MRLLIRMQPHRFPIQISKVGLVGTLLSASVLSWFGPLNEQISSKLEDFEAFMKRISATFGEIEKARMAEIYANDLALHQLTH